MVISFDKLPEEVQEAIERELLPANKIKIPKSLTDPHPIVAKWLQEDKRQAIFERKYGALPKPDETENLELRRRKIISALLTALETRGFQTKADRDYYSKLIWITQQQSGIILTLKERIISTRRRLTKEEKKKAYNPDRQWTQIKTPSGRLILKLSTQDGWDHKAFEDHPGQPLDNQLNEAIGAVIELSWYARQKHLVAQGKSNRYKEEKKRQEQQEALFKAEQLRTKELEDKATAWSRAQNIRQYIEAVERAIADNNLIVEAEVFAPWKQWALAYANNLDPIPSGKPLVELANTAEQD